MKVRWWVALCLFSSAAAAAEVLGPTYPVVEPDLLAWLQARLEAMQKSGEWARLMERWRDTARARLERPAPVAGVTPARKKRVFFVDPSVRISSPIRDASGRVIALPGVFNPLDRVHLHEKLLLLDGDDARQVALYLRLRRKARVKGILVKGAPLELMRRAHVRFWYDQGGRLVRRLRIRHVPALVEQAGRRLKVVEAPPEELG